ncbi:MAG: DUF885 domain-containing protein [Acidimicrobiia bacterium]|nr:DUF885 domain-containing protein [Acidimicrobiia bacterium]
MQRTESGTVSKVYEIADSYVESIAALDPIAATGIGVTGHDHRLTDYSPEGAEARADLARSTLTALAAAPIDDDRDRIASSVMQERLRTSLDLYEDGERLRDLRVIGSPMQSIRQCFDLMPRDTETDWETIAARMEAVPLALAGLRAALGDGLDRGLTAARRQALAAADQAATWGGTASTATGAATPFFLGLAEEHGASAAVPSSLARRLAGAAAKATGAYADTARWLRDEYAPRTTSRDPAGAERYALNARAFCGVELDLAETYSWGWDELRRIEHAMIEVGERILPGRPLAAVMEHLETDTHRSIEGAEEFRRWLQDLLDSTVADLDGRHFDIAEPVKRVEACIAPPGGAAAMYYTGPSEDFSRPGRTWYPTLGKTRFPLWREVSICYHEGVPGHHLQVAQVHHLAETLSRYQRLLGWVSGHGEGWALYAERLMGELGYLDDPAFELGMLTAQAMRAVRVVVDIGMHLELTIPHDEPYHPGERWTPELALPFVIERSRFPADFMASEVDRYLGWPGQAISYKVGERVWLRARDDARRRHGSGFALKAFHAYALDLGSMGLEPFEAEMARF